MKANKNLTRVILVLALIWGGGMAAVAEDPGGDGGQQSEVDLDSKTRRISWFEADRTKPLFIPQAAFDEVELEDLPLAHSSSILLRLDIQRFPEQYRKQFSGSLPPECWPPRSRSSQGSHPDARNLASVLQDGSEVYVGEVTGVVPGWDLHRNQIGQRVTVRILERLHADDEVGPVASDEIFILAPGGRLTIDDTELCDASNPAVHSPKIGDILVLSGYRYSTNPSYFQGLVFPVEDGQVIPQPYGQLKAGQEPVALPFLERMLSGRTPEQRDLP